MTYRRFVSALFVLLLAVPTAWAEEGGVTSSLVDQSVNNADFSGAAAAEAAKIDAAELAKPLSDEFGIKSEAKLGETMNYDDCFDWSYKIKLYPQCPGSCPGRGCFPLVDVSFTYTEPTVLVQVVREPGAGSLEDVPGKKSALKQVLSSGTPSGRSAPGVSPLRGTMPTAGYMPQLYFEAHVWGISPAARFSSSAGQMEVKQSLSCDIADEVGKWPAAIIPPLYLAALPPIVISKGILGNWGFKWFRNAGSSQVAALIGNQTISDIGSTAGFLSDTAGDISSVAPTSSPGAGALTTSASGSVGGDTFSMDSVNGALSDATGAIGDGIGELGAGLKGGAAALVGTQVMDDAGNVIGTIGDAAGTVVDDAGVAIGQLGSASGQVMNDAGEAIGQVRGDVSKAFGEIGDAVAPVTDAVGDAVGQVGEAVAPITDAAGEAIEGVTGAVGDATKQIGDAVAPVTDAVGEAVGEVTGAVGDAFGEVGASLQEGFGELFQGDSMTGFLGEMSEGLAAMGTLSSIGDAAGAFMNGLSSLTNLFSDTKLAPNYISEMQETSWRHGPPGVLASLKSAIGSTPFLCTSDSVLSSIGIEGTSSMLSSICVGSWGPLEPKMGWVPTSGDPFPASGLAGYRGYKVVEYSIWNYKRHTKGVQRFNLDYPHRTGCENIGTPDLRWESRAANSGAAPSLDLASNVFGSGAGGAQNYVAAKAGLSDTRMEAGEYVYTYWKDSSCTMTVCTADWEVLSNKWDY